MGMRSLEKMGREYEHEHEHYEALERALDGEGGDGDDARGVDGA